jgi:hypothetical protein
VWVYILIVDHGIGREVISVVYPTYSTVSVSLTSCNDPERIAAKERFTSAPTTGSLLGSLKTLIISFALAFSRADPN